MGRCIKCPYYVADKRASITCEDCIRQFESGEQKVEHVKKYCQEDWTHCRYAKALTSLYEKIEPMTEIKRDAEITRFRHEATMAEIDKLKKLLGRKIASTERLERDCYALRHRLKVEIGSTERNNAKIKLLEMMVGYLLDKLGQDTVITADMADFFSRHEVKWRAVEGGVQIIKKEK